MLVEFITLITKSTLFITITINVLITSCFIFSRYKFNKKNNDGLPIELSKKIYNLKNIFQFKLLNNKIPVDDLSRNNLGITGLSSWLFNNWENFDDHQRKNYSIAVVENADRMIGFMNNILDFAALSKEDFYLKIEKINLTLLVMERIQECSKLYQSTKKIRFHYDLEPKILVKADKYFIKQAIDNLIINALEHNKGDIYIKLAATQILTSEDNNQHNNIKAIEFVIQDQKKCFKFNKSTSIADISQKNLLGNQEIDTAKDIGLALCKKIIEIHNGFIEFKNNKAGFKFLLPI